MKYFALFALVAAFNVCAQDSNSQANSQANNEPLVDSFKVDPDLKKGANSQYSEKMTSEGKLFHKSGPNDFSVTKGKKNSSDNLDVYQLKMEKVNGKLEKLEQIVEMDKVQKGKVNSVFKCGSHTKGGCQSFNESFCKKLLENDKLDEKLSKDGEPKTLEFYKDLYKEKQVFEPKVEFLSKLQALNEKAVNDVGTKPNNKDLENNLKPVYPSPLVLFKKEKIHGDIAECKRMANYWAEKNDSGNSQPNQVTGKTSAQ